jgi:endonuclease/exonuclease/phosphatase family metal-dependent hydrolase
VRIATWNVCGFRGFGSFRVGSDRKRVAPGPQSADLARAEVWAEILARLEADVIALQEASCETSWRRALTGALGMQSTSLPSPARWPGLLLSRLPIRSGGTPIPLEAEASADGPYSRCGGVVRLGVPDSAGDDSRELLVAALHAHPHDVTMRRREADLLRERLVELGAPVRAAVVLGDFNSEPGETIHEVLRALGFANAFGDAPAPRSHLRDREQTAVDHIYLSPVLGPASRLARAVRDPGFMPEGPEAGAYSDHVPIVVDVGWPEGDSDLRTG